MPWIQTIVDTTPEQAEEIEDLLLAIGALAVTLRDGEDQPIYEPELGTTPLWSYTQVIALFDAISPLSEQMAQLAALYKSENGTDFPHYKVELVEDKDWEREWMDNFHPIQCGERLWICPSWREVPDAKAVNLMLDPGLAFGTGTHPTTFLCLQWLDGQDLENKTIVDFGCGSGILGIAALLLGGANMLGIDIDPQALIATRSNAERNQIGEDKYRVFLPENAPVYQADVVLANILAGPLVALKKAISAYVRPGGDLILSGILREQAEEILAAYEDEYELDPVAVEGDWVRISGRKRV